jgi:riboflavin synthase
MFTGIITDLGTVISREGSRLIIESNYDCANIELGSSIACDGACLTLVAHTATTLAFDVSPETYDKTTLGTWETNKKVNLERALQAGAELGGHFVTGHVDAVGTVAKFTPQGEFWLLEIAYPPELSNYFAPKGSTTVNGVSLTVNTVTPHTIGMTIIPHTAAITNLGLLSTNDKVNLEVDLIARYIAPYLQHRR